MSEKTIIIIESEGRYDIQNNGLSEFELIGILESVWGFTHFFDLSTGQKRIDI